MDRGLGGKQTCRAESRAAFGPEGRQALTHTHTKYIK